MSRSARRQIVVAVLLLGLLVVGLVVSRIGSAARPARLRLATERTPPGAVPADPRRDRTPEGARAAALQYAAGVQEQVVYQSDAEARALLAQWAAPGADPSELDRTASGLDETRRALLSTRGPAWWVVSPLAAKVGPFTPDRARVAVWLVRVLASGGTAGGYVPTSGWLTATIELVWADQAGWSVWTVTSSPGPAPGPTATDHPATSAELSAALDGFSLVQEHR